MGYLRHHWQLAPPSGPCCTDFHQNRYRVKKLVLTCGNACFILRPEKPVPFLISETVQAFLLLNQGNRTQKW